MLLHQHFGTSDSHTFHTFGKLFYLNISEVTNYLPISNLLFLGKKTEQVMTTKHQHVTSANFLDTSQSEFKSGHRTERAIAALKDDQFLQPWAVTGSP